MLRDEPKCQELREKLDGWKAKVLTTYKFGDAADTYRMIKDVDKIIADAFDHEPVIQD